MMTQSVVTRVDDLESRVRSIEKVMQTILQQVEKMEKTINQQDIVVRQLNSIPSSEGEEASGSSGRRIKGEGHDLNHFKVVREKQIGSLIKDTEKNLKKKITTSKIESNSEKDSGKENIKVITEKKEEDTSNPNPDPNSSPDLYSDPNPSADLHPNPYPIMNPKSYSDLNQKLDTNSESGIAMDEEVIAAEIRGNKSVRCNNPDLIEKEKSGEDLEKDNRREITDERIEVPSNQNLGPPHLPSPLPISQPSPPSRSSSLPTLVCPSWPTLWSHSLLSSLNPSDNVTETMEKMSITRSGKLFRNGRVQKLSKPILAILSRPKTNLGNLLDSDVLMWPKLHSEFLMWHKPRINLMRPFNFVTYVVVRFTMNSLGGVSGDLRKLPRPRPPPLPWPPPTFTPLPPPALALNRRDLEELVKLLSQKFSNKLHGELDLLYVGCWDAIVEPNQRGDVHEDSVVGFINPRMMKVERINEQRMFIKDSGAADNFILEGLVSKIKLPTKVISEYGIIRKTCVPLTIEWIFHGVVYLQGIKIVGKFLPIKLEKLYLILAMQRIQTFKQKGTVDKNESRCAAALVDGILERVWASRFVYNLEPVVRTKMYPNSERKSEVEAWNKGGYGLEDVMESESIMKLEGVTRKLVLLIDSGVIWGQKVVFLTDNVSYDFLPSVLVEKLGLVSKDGWLGDAHREPPPPPLPPPPAAVVDIMLLNRGFYFFPP